MGKHGIREKDVTLSVGRLLAEQLQARDIEVVLTRSSDQTIALDDRASLGNESNPALFVSLHANSSIHPTVQGIETFFLQDNLFRRTFSTIDAADSAQLKTYESLRYNASKSLAQKIQNAAVSAVQKKHADAVDGRIRCAAPQVLVGSTAPSVLIELGYLSHSSEAQRLGDTQYQEILAQGVAEGIASFLSAQEKRS